MAARLLAGAALLMIAALAAPDALRAEEPDSAPATEQEAMPAPPSDDEPLPEDIDFNALAVPLDQSYTPSKLRQAPRENGVASPVWSRNDRPNGTAAVSVKRSVSPFWDIKAGVDLDVATQSSPLHTPETLPEKLAADSRVEHSQAAAWMSAKAPGVPYFSDHVALEARMNPSRDARLGTSFSKSLPLYDEKLSLTLRHGYYLTQHDAIPGMPATSAYSRSFDMERSAEFSINDTGTSLLAGQALAPAGDRWLNSIGARQELFGGVNVTGSVSDTPAGVSNKSFSAGYKKSW